MPLTFNIRHNAVVRIAQYEFQPEKCTWTWIVNAIDQPHEYFEKKGSYEIIGDKNVMFDMIEITSTIYTSHRLCITLWKKGVNALQGSNHMFLPIYELERLLELSNYTLSDKQVKTLNIMFERFAKKKKCPRFQLEKLD